MRGSIKNALTGMFLCGASVVHAQAIPDPAPTQGPASTNFERNRNTSVLERPRPLYDALGYKLGGFTLKPTLSTGLEYNDNIFAQPAGKTDDLIVTVKPNLALSSNWSRNAFSLFAGTASRFYTGNGNESTTDWNTGGKGRLDIEQAKLNVGGSYGYFSEPRTSTNTSRVASKPVRFYAATANGELSRDFNYLRLSARVDYLDLNYKNAVDTLNAFVLQDSRDHDVVTYTGRADVAISPSTALFVVGSYNTRSYSFDVVGSPRRDSKGWEADGGITFDITNLLRGDIRVGYLRQNFDDVTYGHTSGLSGRAVVSWFPTQLTTVTVRAARSVEETTDVRSSSYLSGSGGLTVDHELLRNVVLSGGFNVAWDNYKGIDRDDTRYTASVSANYYMNRFLSFSLGYDYLNQKSKGLDANALYKVNRVLLGAKVQY